MNSLFKFIKIAHAGLFLHVLKHYKDKENSWKEAIDRVAVIPLAWMTSVGMVIARVLCLYANACANTEKKNPLLITLLFCLASIYVLLVKRLLRKKLPFFDYTKLPVAQKKKLVRIALLSGLASVLSIFVTAFAIACLT